MDVHVQRYPLDLTAKSPLNLIEDEVRKLVGGKERFFAPHGGAFYFESVSIYDIDNSKRLSDDQYRSSLYFAEPSERSNNAVYAGLVITDESVSNNLKVSYQVVGGHYSSIAPAIIDAMGDLQINNREVRWGNILGRPEFLPPADHLQDIADIYGFEYIVNLMNKVHTALLVGDGASHDEIFAMLDNRLDRLNDYYDVVLANLDDHEEDYNDPHDVTKLQVKLEKVDNFAEATNSDMDSDGVIEKFVTPARLHYAFTQMWNPDFEDHLTDYNNPHQVTKAQVDLGSLENYPMANTALTTVGENDYTYIHPLGMRYAIEEQGGRLVDQHIADKENPHDVTKAQVGLGKVINYPVATVEQAKLGKVAAYVTPKTLNVEINALVGLALSSHTSDYNNPHDLTKFQVGLGNVDNISLDQMDDTFQASGDMSSVNLDGQVSYYQAEDIDLHVTNYHVGSSYDVSTPTGDITIRGKVLEGHIDNGSPLGKQPLTMSQDGKTRTVHIDIKFSGAKKPSMTGPTLKAGQSRIPVNFTASSTPFSVIPRDSFDSHHHSIWQVSKDSGFTNLLVNRKSQQSLTQHDMPMMPQDTDLWLRVKHAGHRVSDSPWSDGYKIHTQRNPKPSVSATGNRVDGRITREFNMVGSPFKGDGNHTKTQWRVYAANDSVIWDKTVSGADTQYTPYDHGFRPDSDVGLKLQVRYYSDTAHWSDWSDKHAIDVMRRRVTSWTTSKETSKVTERISSFVTRFQTSRVTQVYMERMTSWTTNRQTTKVNNWTTQWTSNWTTNWVGSRSTSFSTFYNRNTNHSVSTNYTTKWGKSKTTSRRTSRNKTRSTQYRSYYMQFTYSFRTTDTLRTTSRSTSGYNPGPGGCISTDTPLTLSNGKKLLAGKVSVGDVIKGAIIPGMVDESEPNWREWTTDDISRMYKTDVTVKNVDLMSFRAATCINDSLIITKQHEVLANRGNGWSWFDVRDLEVGDIMIGEDLKEVLIEDMTYITGDFDVVSIDVEETDTYFAGGLLVHNLPGNVGGINPPRDKR